MASTRRLMKSALSALRSSRAAKISLPLPQSGSLLHHSRVARAVSTFTIPLNSSSRTRVFNKLTDNYVVSTKLSLASAGFARKFHSTPLQFSASGASQQHSVEETISILRGLRKHYEQQLKLKISDSAPVSAAYITEGSLPDKAIDPVDEAAAKLKMDEADEKLFLENDTYFMTLMRTIDEDLDRINLEMEAAERKYGTLMFRRPLEEAENKLVEFRKSGQSLLREETEETLSMSEIGDTGPGSAA